MALVSSLQAVARKIATNRNVQHFMAAFITALGAQVALTAQPLTLEILLAAIPGAGSVALRSLLPNPAEAAAKTSPAAVSMTVTKP